MKYLVLWAHDCDYSAWHIDADGDDSQAPQLMASLDEARAYLARVATRNPDLVARVYEVSAIHIVAVELTEPVVSFIKEPLSEPTT